MRVPRNIPQVVFLLDVDGTLVDLNIDYDELKDKLRRYFQRLGVEVRGDFSPILKRIRELGIAAAKGDEQRASEICGEAYSIIDDAELTATKNASTLRGARELLEFLQDRKFRFGICTRNSAPSVKQAFRQLGLPLPGVIVGRGDLPASELKPAAQHPLRTLMLIDPGADPERAILVGDSVIDVMAARASSMTSCFIGDIEGWKGAEPDLHFDDLFGLLTYIKGLEPLSFKSS